MVTFLWIAFASLIIALISGVYGQRNGFSFWRQFITGFIASIGILSLMVKLVKEYL